MRMNEYVVTISWFSGKENTPWYYTMQTQGPNPLEVLRNLDVAATMASVMESDPRSLLINVYEVPA